MLSDRRQRVLAALIEEYVNHALPVGSRTLVQNYQLGVSSATVRNELSVLEDDGYITQPHTSAGRVPTDYGYRSFVDHLLSHELNEDELDEEAQKAVSDLRASANELDDLLDRTTAALSHLTDCLSIVLPPSTLSLHIRQITLVSLSPRRALMIVVTEDGQVINRQMEFANDIPVEKLGEAQSFLNKLFCGKSLSQIKDGIDGEVSSSLQDPLFQMLVGELLHCLEEGDAGHAHRLGLSTLMRKPEFAHSTTLVPILQVLENDAILLQILSQPTGGKPSVKIGHENGNEQLSGVSVVAEKYGRGASEGVVAVIGPTRMDYAQVIKAVHVARKALDDQ